VDCKKHPEACKDALKTPVLDPIAFLAGGIAGGLRALGARLFRAVAADAAATAGSSAAIASTASAAEEVAPVGIRFAQRGISSTFRSGEFAGKSVKSVAGGLPNGTISASQLPLNVVVRDGVTYTMNNRSLMALRLADKVPTVINNVTGDPRFEQLLTERLGELGNKAAAGFVPSVRP